MSLSDDEFNEKARRFLLDSQTERTLTSYESDPLVVPVEENNPRYYTNLYTYHAARRVDGIAEVLMQLPSILGMAEVEPAILKIPMKLDDTVAGDGPLALYSPAYNTVYLHAKILASLDKGNVLFTEAHSGEFKETITTGHEYRHGFQEARKLMELPDDFPEKFKAIYTLLLERVIEADANAFTCVIAQDVVNNPFLLGADAISLEDEAEILPFESPMQAYERSVKGNEQNHHTGRAASAAFMAMFSEGNHEYLNSYDIRVARHISEFNPVRADSLYWNDFLHDRNSWDAFRKHIAGFATMPREHDGVIIEREFYDSPLKLDMKTLLSGLNADALLLCGFKQATLPASARGLPQNLDIS